MLLLWATSIIDRIINVPDLSFRSGTVFMRVWAYTGDLPVFRFQIIRRSDYLTFLLP